MSFRVWMVGAAALFVMTNAAVACGGAHASSHNAAADKPIPSTSASAPPAVSDAGTWNCMGEPPDVAPGWRIEIATVPAWKAGAPEIAARAVQDKLRTKLCVNADNDRTASDACSYLASKIEPWTTGTDGHDVCASAVIKSTSIEEWRRLATNLDDFDKSLAASANYLVAAAAKGHPPRIAVVAVYDDNSDRKQNQLPGGLRADWLAARFRAAFAPFGGLAMPPKGWVDGDGPPAGLDMIVVGHMFKRTTVSLPEVEVSWTGTTADGRQVETSSGSFREAAAPPPPASTPPPLPATPGLHVSMDSDHAGSICAGETTQLWLKSDEQLHVRVFDLYGSDGAMLIYPPDRTKSDVVPAKHTIPLGDEKGFEAIPLPGTEDERYLVIAAPTIAGLGRYARLNGYCRLTPEEGAKLRQAGSLPPGAQIAVTGYRLITGKSCPNAPSPEHLKAANNAIAQLPVCSL